MTRGEMLIVDDEPALVDLLVAVLEEEGYRVRSVSDGHAALTVLARTRLRLVVAACRERSDPIPTIFISAGPGRTCPAATVCVAKPFDVDRCSGVIAGILGAGAW